MELQKLLVVMVSKETWMDQGNLLAKKGIGSKGFSDWVV